MFKDVSGFFGDNGFSLFCFSSDASKSFMMKDFPLSILIGLVAFIIAGGLA